MYTLRKALTIIFVSIVVVTGGSMVTLFYLRQQRQQDVLDPRYIITRITQTGPDAHVLPEAYYSLLLSLEKEPINAYAFSAERARARLLSSPWISDCKITVRLPRTLEIAPKLRKPIARLYNIEGALVDREGTLFPALPAMASDSLPEWVAKDLPRSPWGGGLPADITDLAMELMDHLKEFNVRRYDLTDAFAESLGRRQIVLTVEDDSVERFLRISPRNWKVQMGNYRNLQGRLKDEHVVDLRIERLAFISKK